MDSELREWQLDIERIWQAAAPDWREAARLADVMARTGGEAMLRQAAAQALPILRHAAVDNPDPGIAASESSAKSCMSSPPRGSAGATSR